MTGRITRMTEEERREKRNAYMKQYQRNNPMTEEQRRKYNEYQRQYRKNNPEKVKRSIENSIIKRAARLLAEREAGKGIKNEQS